MIEPKGYRLVMADPPWKFETWSEKGQSRSAQRHYECMSTDDICALWRGLNMDFSLHQDCVLWLWATWPMLDDARFVMKTWGFAYKTGGVWVKLGQEGKPITGTGYTFGSACEPFLIGKFGHPGRPINALVSNVIMAKRREHSRKPEEAYQIAEDLYPSPRLELFARTKRKGWDTWGNETEKFEVAV